jgi:hypothetical protein
MVGTCWYSVGNLERNQGDVVWERRCGVSSDGIHRNLTSYGGNVWWFRIQIIVVWRCMKWKMVPRHRCFYCFLFRKMWVTAFTREVAVPTGLPRVLRMLWHSARSSQRWNGFRSLDDSLVFHAFPRNRAKMYLDDPVNQLRRGSCWMWMNR